MPPFDVTGPAAVPPDTKVCTVVIDSCCAECGVAPQAPGDTGTRLRSTIPMGAAPFLHGVDRHVNHSSSG